MGQENPKFHVSDDGKVFVVNDDGTTTEYGRVVPGKEKRPRKPIPCFVLWIVAIVLLTGVSFCSVFKYKITWIAEYTHRCTADDVFDSLVPLSWFCIGLMLLVIILIGCVIRLNNKIRADK